MGLGRQRGRRLIFIMLPLLMALFTIASILANDDDGDEQTVPIIGREQQIDLTDEQQEALGERMYDDVRDAEGDNIIAEGEQYDMVMRVAERVTDAADEDADDFDWSVTLIDSPRATAYALPDGKIVVYTGIIPIAQNDAGLAAVLGHVVGHAVARHGVEHLSTEGQTATGLQVAGGALEPDSAEYQ